MEKQIFTQEDIRHIKSVYKKIIDHEKRIADEHNKNRREVSNRDTLMRLLNMREREYQVKQELTLERIRHSETMMEWNEREKENESKQQHWYVYQKMIGALSEGRERLTRMHHKTMSELEEKLKGIQAMINVYKLGDGVNSLTLWGLNSGLEVRPLRFRAPH